jgi:hypothetical protein
MGRPLNKKYFGNRNIGTNRPTDDMIGGQGVGSVSQPSGGAGSFVVNQTYQNFPTLTASAPTIANGTTAVLSPVFEIETVTYASGGATGYANGLSTSISGMGGGAVVNIVLTTGAVSSVNLTGGNRGEFRRGDITGVGLTTFNVRQTPNAGTDLQINVTFRVKRIEVTNSGSGYVTAPSLSWGGHTFTGQTAPSLNVVTMATDTGAVGSATYEENAIIAWAYTGGQFVEVDLQKQISTKRYRFNKTGEVSRVGVEIGRIRYDHVADGTGGYTAAQGKELNIFATDASGGTYLVRKLYNRTCTLYPFAVGSSLATATGLPQSSAGTLYTRGEQVKWSFAAASAGVVQIQNA